MAADGMSYDQEKSRFIKNYDQSSPLAVGFDKIAVTMNQSAALMKEAGEEIKRLRAELAAARSEIERLKND
jgi:hypothetical protein